MSGAPCARGEAGPTGKFCAFVAHAPVTAEGFHVLRALKRASSWEGGGFARLRLDRAQTMARMPDGLDTEALCDMLDAAEGAALAAIAERQKPGASARP